MDDNDPRQVIFSFLDALPPTIRTEALLFVIMYAMDDSIPEDKAMFATAVNNYLMKDEISGISAVICTIAAVEHSFGGLVSNLDRAEAKFAAVLARDPTNRGLQISLLSLPIRRRHWEQAWAAWHDLRKTKLTPQNIQDFADNLLMPRRQQ